MTTLYAYSTETNRLLARITGADNVACEAAATAAGYEGDGIGWTYTPAFDAAGGLEAGENVADITA
jgi:hypothetical protein